MIDKHLLTEADHVLKAEILSEATFSHLCISRVAKKIMVFIAPAALGRSELSGGQASPCLICLD